jgi:hypothetical protein
MNQKKRKQRSVSLRENEVNNVHFFSNSALMRSKAKRDPKFELNTDHINKEFEKSSCIRRLWDLFIDYESQMKSEKPGNTKRVVSMGISKEEAEDLFFSLKFEVEVSKKKRKKGVFTNMRIVFKTREALRRFFGIFKNQNPRCDYFFLKGAEDKYISKEEYINLIETEAFQGSLCKTTLGLELFYGVKGKCFLNYLEDPKKSGGNLTFEFWYDLDMPLIRKNSFRLPLEKAITFSDQQIDFKQWTMEEHQIDEEKFLASQMEKRDYIEMMNKHNRGKALVKFKLNL